MSEDIQDPKAAERARVRAAADAIVDGVYFNLPAEIYHAVRRLNTSGLQLLDVSAPDFWENSWLNDDAAELDEDSTKAQILGKAYHTARLEPHLFEAQYCREIGRDDFPVKGAVYTGTDIGEALAALPVPQPKSKAGESVLDKAQRLEAAGYTAGIIYPIEVAKWEAARGARTAIPGKFYDDILKDMDRIRKNPDIAALLSDGAGEVSIFWTDDHGLPMKTRLDFLRVDGWADLKTFANPQRKRIDQVLRESMMYSRLHVQAVVQREAIERIRSGKIQIIGEADDAERDLFAAVQLHPGEMTLHFVFIQKGGVPNQIAMEFPFFEVPDNIKDNWDPGATEAQKAAAHAATRTSTALHNIGRRTITAGKEKFVLYSQVYQHGQPWFPIEGVGRYNDGDFPPFFLENN